MGCRARSWRSGVVPARAARRSGRALVLAGAAAVGVTLAALSGGCSIFSSIFSSSSATEFRTDPEPWGGPSIEVTQTEGQNAVIVRAPSPGWTVTLDGDRRRLDYDEVFVTLREPDPAFVYPQVIAEHRLLTSVPAERDIEVYARTLGFNQDSAKYHPVGTK